MYALIKTGGKQFKVAAGEKIKVEQIAADVGQEIVIDQVLAVGNGAGRILAGSLSDNPLDPIESTTNDKENVGSINLDEILLRVFSSTLWWYRRNSSFHDFK